MEQNNQNRRRRRSSITQHLQRIFNIDKQETQRQHEACQVPSNINRNARPAPDQEGPEQRANDRSVYGYQNDLSFHHKEASHYSYPSMSSKPTQTNQISSRYSSVQPTPRGSSTERDQSLERLQGTPRTNGIIHKSEDITPAAYNNSTTQKKEKRVTRRLEAERLELEKRLLKLEQVQLSGDYNSSKRETRRLTKKQPIGSSSRGSSVGADEPRSSSSRLSAFFSSSRRTRSRSSSATEKDGAALANNAPGSKEKRTDGMPTLRAAKPSLSTSLPERFGAVISKGLVVEGDTLLQSYAPLMESQPSLTADASPSGDAERLGEKPLRDLDETSQPQRLKVKPSIEQAGPAGQRSDELRNPPRSSDLDQVSFAATLNLAQRGRDGSKSHSRPLSSVQQSLLPQKEVAQTENHDKPQTLESSKPRVASGKVHSEMNISGSLSANTSGNSVPRGYPRTTKSSSLAGAPLSGNGSQSPLGSKRASRVRNSLLSDGTRRVPPSPLATVATNISPSDESLKIPQPSTAKGGDKRRAPDASIERTVKSIHGAKSCVSGESKVSARDPPQRSKTHRWSRRSTPITDSTYKLQRSTTPDRSRLCSPTNNGYDSHPNLTNGGQEEDTSAYVPRLERARQDGQSIPTLLEHSDQGKVDSQNAAPTSNLSSRSSSPELSSEDYNTADEAGSFRSVSEGGGDRLIDHPPKASEACPKHTSPRVNRPTRPGRYPDTVVSQMEDCQTDRSTAKTESSQLNQSVMKDFVVCCSCKSWHDIPPDIYAKVTGTKSSPVPPTYGPSVSEKSPKMSTRLTRATTSVSPSTLLNKQSTIQGATKVPQEVSYFTDSFAQCCWCSHHMSTQCCEGLAATVHMRGRHHW